MRDTFLFDLDGTLLPMDFDQFMKLYFTSMAKTFYGVIEPERLINNINETTKVTVMTNDGRTNEEIFMEFFNTLIEEDIKDYIPLWDAFYDALFLECKNATWQNEDMIKAIEVLKDKGYKLAIATNPLLPLKSNLHRVKWAGLDINDFNYISSFEENRYCKPHLEFYQEVCEKLQVDPKKCYMIGNDVSEDLVAKHLDMETYLITDCMINKRDKEIITDHQGTYQDFLGFVKNLAPIK